MIARHPPQVVIAVSNAIARQHDDIDWLRDRLRVVRNPVTQLARPPREPVAGSIVFAYLGRLTREKGVSTLVDAFARSGLAPNARLLIAGEGPLRSEIERRAEPGVELLGWVDARAKEELFDTLDCLVVPSEWPDPAPLVIDEARGRAIPVIGARAGGIPELISPADEPLLFSAGDAVSLSTSLQRFAAQPDRYADDASGICDWDAHVDAVIAAYDDALRSR
jgi:glycosyltransferase involved in cell wall biosynthesis